jgi:uncharacterized protein (DUF58 family)
VSVSAATIQDAFRRGAAAGARYALAVPAEAGGRSDGRRTGPRSGRSQDFRDFRDYHPGDDLRWVDWAVYARSDRLSVRVFEEEVCPHADIVLDTSRSMALAETRKAEAAAGLAALLAVAAANAGFSACVWTDGAGLMRLPGTPTRPETWPSPSFDGRTSLVEQWRAQPPTLRRRGVRFLISDLLWPGEPAAVLQHLGNAAAAVHVVQVLAEADLRPADHGFLRVADSETGQELDLFLDASARQQYAAALAMHRAAWDEGCRRYRASLHGLVVEDLLLDGIPTDLLRGGVLEGA